MNHEVLQLFERDDYKSKPEVRELSELEVVIELFMQYAEFEEGDEGFYYDEQGRPCQEYVRQYPRDMFGAVADERELEYLKGRLTDLNSTFAFGANNFLELLSGEKKPGEDPLLNGGES